MAEEKSASKVAIIVAMITVIGGSTVALINKCNFSSKSEADVTSNKIIPEKQSSEAKIIDTTTTTTLNDTTIVDPSKLADIIKDQQKQAVRVSYNETDCFTDVDLKNFISERKAEHIVNTLMLENSFVKTVIAVKKMPPVERQELLKSCLKTAKPTWRERGQITPEGQTDAGKEAELMISKAIVDKVEKLIKLSIKELEKLYQ